MSKGYLSAEEKKICFTLGTLSAYMDTLVGTTGDERVKMPEIEGIWTKLRKPPKNRIKYARMARTYVNKTIEDMLEDVESSEALKMLRDIKSMDIIVKYKDEAKRYFEEQKNKEDIVMYQTEIIKDMADVLFGDTCYQCRRYDKEVKECAIKKVLLEADIDPIEPKPKSGHCPYQWRGEKKKKRGKKDGEQGISRAANA